MIFQPGVILVRNPDSKVSLCNCGQDLLSCQAFKGFSSLAASLSLNLKHSQQTKSHIFLTEAFGFFPPLQHGKKQFVCLSENKMRLSIFVSEGLACLYSRTGSASHIAGKSSPACASGQFRAVDFSFYMTPGDSLTSWIKQRLHLIK